MRQRIAPRGAQVLRAWLPQRSCSSQALPDSVRPVANGFPSTAQQFVTVHFDDPNQGGRRLTVQADVGESVVDVAKRHGVDIHAACGQQLQCATCHVILQKAFYHRLPAPGVREEDMLETAYTLTATSRLGCQVRLGPELDGIVLTLPDKEAKSLVRMTTDQPRPKVSASWNDVPAVFTPAAVRRAATESQLSRPTAPGGSMIGNFDQEWKGLYQEQRIRSAFLEQQLQEIRAERSGKTSGANGAKGKSGKASQKLTEKASTGDDSDDETGDLQKLKKELESTIVRLDSKSTAGFDEVVGLADAKRVLRESVLWPALGPPALFKGIRGKCRGVMLYGPPGCGKTMVARAAASELCGADGAATFFHIRPADVMSKFYGDSQKRIAALEELAKERSPAIVFIDEVDTLLGKRDGGQGVAEHHKGVTNAILTWMDGFDQGADRVFFIGATNRAEAIDEAALRRFGEMVEVGLPDLEQRKDLLEGLVRGAAKDGHRSDISPEQLEEVAKLAEGMSGDDVARLAQQAYMEVLRDLLGGVHKDLTLDEVPPVTFSHFEVALRLRVRASGQVYQSLQQRGKARQAAM